jgi:hypothetical protein
MSLRAFHLLFVAASTLLAFGLGGWCISASRAGQPGYLALSIACFAVGVGLIVYGVWFQRKIRTVEQEKARKRRNLHRVPVVFAAWALGTRAADACSVCYGEAQGPMIDAARLGVWLLFGLVLMIQLAFVAFFVYLYLRAKRYRAKHPEVRWAD